VPHGEGNQPITKSWYDALELQARQRVRDGNNLQLSYTLSRSPIDGVGREATTRSLQRASLQALAVVRGALAGLPARGCHETATRWSLPTINIRSGR
jgi:multidrug efflux pump subunit AcrA (membrane-fusion protein)